MTLFDLVAKLTLDSSQYEQGLSSAGNTATSFAQKIGSGIGTAAKIGVAAIGAVTTAAISVGTAMTKAIANTAAFGDNIDKMSQKMNLSAESFQEWDAVMQHSGTSIESLQASMKTLANAVENGSEAFERLGITQEQIASMNNEELFSATISALQNVEDETERTYLAGKLLGRGATELGPLLNMTAEETQQLKDRVHELGGVMSDEAVKAAAAYTDSIQDMKTAFTGMSRGMIAELLPSWTRIVDGLTEIFAGNTVKGANMISQGVDAAIQQIDRMLPQVVKTAGRIVKGIGSAIQKNFPKILKTGADIVGQLASGIINALPSVLQSGISAITEFAKGLVDGIPDAIPQIVEAVMDIAEALTDPANLVALVDAGLDIIVALADGIIDSLPVLLDRLPVIIDNIVTTLVEAAPKLMEAAGQIVLALVNYFVDPANLQQITAAGGQIVLTLIAGIGNFLGNMAEAAADIIDALVSALAEAAGLGPLYEQGKGALGEFVRGLRESLQSELPDLASNVYSNLAADLESAETLADVYNAGAKAFREFIRGIYESMPELWGILEGIFAFSGNPGAMMAFDQLEQSLAEEGSSSFGSAAAKMVEGAQTEMTSAGEEMADLLLDSFEAKGIDASMLAADNIPPAFSGAFKSHNGEFEADGSAAGEAVGRGIVSGLDLSKSAAIQAAIELARSVIQSFKSELQISSPSKVTREFGRFFDQGFALGITDELDAISDAADRAAATASEALSAGAGAGAVDYVVGDMAAQRNQTAPGQSGAWGDVVALLGEIRDKIGGDVVLDSGQLVGYMDAALGSLSVRKARGGSFA